MSVDPDVTVVVGAYNAMPYLTKCVSSVLEQSIDLDRLELIAVDDGSTDGTGAELDRFAVTTPAMQVIHQENSGGPAGPRNRGIDLARGRYLFFLDADDYLGLEALERMVAMADRNRSDVVVGRRVGVGRGTPQSIFRHNRDRADLFTSGVWDLLSAQKLFRKELVDRLGLRFPDLPIGQDQPFTATAYLHADVISVLGDYECYYFVRRDDGGNNTVRQRDIRDWLRFVETMVHLVADHLPPGDRRDTLMRRQFRDEFRRATFSERFLEASPKVRAEAVTRAKVLVDTYYTPRLDDLMSVDGRLRFHLISRGMVDELAELIRFHLAREPRPVVVDNGRIYAGYPFFRDPSLGIPDRCYDITNRVLQVNKVSWADGGNAAIVLAGRGMGDVTFTLTRDRGNGEAGAGPVHRVAAQRDEEGRYTAVVPLGSAAGGKPLPYGHWHVAAEVTLDAQAAPMAVARPSRALRRRVWWRRGVPSVVATRRWGDGLVLVAAPVVSFAVARAAAAAVRRRVSRLRPARAGAGLSQEDARR